MKAILPWIKNNRLEALLLTLIISIASFVRFYKIDQYMTYLGDEGRDSLMIERILTTFDIPLIGAPTSVGNMHLGPFYYYMMTVPMTIFYLNPVAAAAMVALIGVLTVGLIYYLTRVWFGRGAAVVASVLYALSPVNIIYSKSSWNPNPAPFFALISIWGFYKAHKGGNFYWLILVGFGVAATLQMHYLAILLLPIYGILWLYELNLVWRKKMERRNFWTGSILGVFAFLLMMLPLVVFDIKHGYPNYRAFMDLFTSKESSVGFNLMDVIIKIIPIYYWDLTGRYIAAQNQIVAVIISILVLVPLSYAKVQKIRGKSLPWTYVALYTWLFVGILGLGLYRNTIYDHYLGFINPVPFILLGSVYPLLGKIKNPTLSKIAQALFIFLIVVTVYLNLNSSPLKSPPNMQLQRTQGVAQYIVDQAGGRPFNFALIAERNYDSAYQFYLGRYGNKPKQVPFEITEQLYVVCEDKVCNPINHSKYEIAGYGMSKIESENEFMGVKIFKLVPNR